MKIWIKNYIVLFSIGIVLIWALMPLANHSICGMLGLGWVLGCPILAASPYTTKMIDKYRTILIPLTASAWCVILVRTIQFISRAIT